MPNITRREPLAYAPAEWAALVESTNDRALREMEREAAAAAIHLARLSAYLSWRLNGHKHATAVREQNSVAAKVRHALGFTFARTDITF